MHAIYLLSVWLHIIAAMTWVGGMLFLVLVVVPWLRRGDRATAGAFLRETGQRFRAVGWACFALLLATGLFNLWARGVRLADFGRLGWLTSGFGRSVLIKLGLFAAVLAMSVVHDFFVGPAASVAITRDPRSSEAERLRSQASLLGRANAILGLTLVGVAVTIVRGWP